MPTGTIQGNRYEVYSTRDQVHTTLALAEFPATADFSYETASSGTVLTVVSDVVLDYLRDHHDAPAVSEFAAGDIEPFFEWYRRNGRSIVFHPTAGNGLTEERPLDASDIEPFIGTRYGLGLG